jgi:hypothetical protein
MKFKMNRMNEIEKSKNRDLLLFFILTFLWSWLLWFPQVLDSAGYSIPGFLLFLGNLAIFGPFFAAFLLTYLNNGKERVKILFKRGLNHRFNKKWFIPIVFLTPCISFLSLLVVLFFEGNEPLEYTISWAMFFPILVIIFF